MIGFANTKQGWFPAAIRFFTRSKISHSFITIGDICGLPAVLEANLTVEINPFYRDYINVHYRDYALFQVNRGEASEEKIEKAKQFAFESLAGQHYGLLQCVWFIYRWMNELIGRDIRKQKNWMSDGVICSEVCYWFLYSLGGKFKDLLKDYNPDTIQAEDIRRIVVANPSLFILWEIKSDSQEFQEAMGVT